MTTLPQAAMDVAAQHAENWVILIVLGLAFLWVLSLLSEIALNRLRPVALFLVVAALVGAVVARMLTNL